MDTKITKINGTNDKISGDRSVPKVPTEDRIAANFNIFVKKLMPTVLLTKGYRFFFYINDHSPPHIHVEKGRCTAKFNLENTELIKSRRFNAKEIGELRKLVLEHSELFKSKWNEYFNG